jgi:hypothetical protein
VSERITLEAPLDGTFGPVVRLIVGGIAERADFGFEDMDDLQLAIERLLAEASSEGRVSMAFDIAPGRIRVSVGPLHEQGLANALQEADRVAGRPTLRRILTTVVDSYGLEDAAGGEMVIRLEKVVGAGV